MLGFIWPEPFFCMGACEFVQIAGGAQHDWSVRRILQFKPAKVMSWDFHMALEWRGPALDVRAVRAQCRKATRNLQREKSVPKFGTSIQ